MEQSGPARSNFVSTVGPGKVPFGSGSNLGRPPDPLSTKAGDPLNVSPNQNLGTRREAPELMHGDPMGKEVKQK